jgi:hypothetical protein
MKPRSSFTWSPPPRLWPPLGKLVCQRCGDFFVRPPQLAPEIAATRCEPCALAERHARRVDRELEVALADAPRRPPAKVPGVVEIRDERLTG